MNEVFLLGRLTADPELKYTSGNEQIPVCTFTLAVDRPTSKDTADFPTIVAWRDTAVFVSKYLSKGRRIVVHGSIRTRNYEDKDGNHRKATEVQAERIAAQCTIPYYMRENLNPDELTSYSLSELARSLADGLKGFMKVIVSEDPSRMATIVRGEVRVIPPDHRF